MGAAGALMLFLMAAGLAPALGAGMQLAVRAEPDRGGVGSGAGAAIIVEVRTATGEAARDGTQVQFASTLGTITPVAETVGGVARGILTSNSAGTAQVSVLVGSDRADAYVEFTAEASGKARAESRLARISGGYLAYSADQQVFIVNDKAKLDYQGLLIHADSLQFDLARNQVRAQHLVRVEGAGATLEGERLSYSGTSQSGVLLRIGTDRAVERVGFRGAALTPQAEAADAQASFQPLDGEDTRTWVIARQATVFPYEKIQFIGASVYVNDVHLLDLPIYVLRLRGYAGGGNYLDQVFSLNSQGGLSVDFPLYYAATEKRTGSLHIRRVAPGSFGGYSGLGWSLGIVEQYERGRAVTGTLALENLTDSTRGFRWDHHQQFGANSRLDLYLNHQRYSPDYPGISTAYSYFYRRIKDAGLTLSMRATRYGGSTDLASDLAYRWSGKRLPKTDIGYDFALEGGYGESPRNAGLPYNYGYQPAGREFYYGMNLGVYPAVKDLDRRTTLTTSVGTEYAWFLDGATRDALEARATVRRNLGQTSNASLSYSYALRHGDWYAGLGRERLDLNVYASKGQKWDLYGYLSKNLSEDGMFGSANFSYQLPFEKNHDGTSKWRFDATAAYSKYGAFALTDTRFALGRDIGSYEVRLCYSPQGSGGYGPYGYASGSTGRKTWLELGAKQW